MTIVDTITHPEQKKLAQALLDGVDPLTLYPKHGKSRVMDMQKRIAFYENDPEAYMRKEYLACKICGI